MSFVQKNFIQILQDEIDHMAATSTISDFNTGSVVRTFFEGVALVVDEAYFQLVNILNGFYINTATGTDLDRRASDYGLQRKLATQANVLVTFSGSGSPVIPAGTIVAVPAGGGNPQINFLTTSAGTVGSPIPATAQLTGTSGNVGNSTVTLIVTNPNPVLVTSVTNASASSGGQDQEADNTFRARLQLFLQSLSKGTVNSIISAAMNVTGVKVAEVLEGYSLNPTSGELFGGGATLVSQSGSIVVVIDDGTGALPAATVPIVENILVGSTTDPVNFPGYKAAGIQCLTTRPLIASVPIAMSINVQPNIIDSSSVVSAIQTALSTFVQQKQVGEPLYLSEVVDQTMNVTGVKNVEVSTVLLNGTNGDQNPPGGFSGIGGKLVAGVITVTVI